MSILSNTEALRVARYHLQQATSLGMIEYWTRVVASLEQGSMS